MCQPHELKQRIDPSEFERYELEEALLHVQKELLTEGILEFTIPGKGKFSLSVRRGGD